MTRDKIVRMEYVIQEYLKRNKIDNAKPKDLMPLLMEKGYFEADHRNGLPLRNILRELDDSGELYLLPQVKVERKETNRFWFFSPLGF